jgi:glutathione S-transferase
MTYTLAIADRTYSSWSLRGWLLFVKFGIPVTVREARLYTDELPRLLAGFGGARTVPAVLADDGQGPIHVWDSLAIAETLAERHPDAGHWPKDGKARALARSLAAEMHSSFRDLRTSCPMNLQHQWRGFAVSPEVEADLDKLCARWALARQRFGGAAPWLFGTYTAADAFYAPVAARVAGYGLRLPQAARDYVEAHLADPAFLQWRRAGLEGLVPQPKYDMGLPVAPWPGPA